LICSLVLESANHQLAHQRLLKKFSQYEIIYF